MSLSPTKLSWITLAKTFLRCYPKRLHNPSFMHQIVPTIDHTYDNRGYFIYCDMLYVGKKLCSRLVGSKQGLQFTGFLRTFSFCCLSGLHRIYAIDSRFLLKTVKTCSRFLKDRGKISCAGCCYCILPVFSCARTR